MTSTSRAFTGFVLKWFREWQPEIFWKQFFPSPTHLFKGKRVGNITAEMPTSGIYNLISANPYFPTSLIKPTTPHKFYGSKGFLI